MGTDQHLAVRKDGEERKDGDNVMEHHGWMVLPTEPLVQILFLLDYVDLARCCQVCRRWSEISSLSYIWKRRFQIDFNVDPEVPISVTATSWKTEYQRVVDLVPSIEVERISEHTDEVLHVSFSNNGMRFCTCSKDATVKVFNADWPFNTIFDEDLGMSSQFRWMYTQFSQFSHSDTQLLVSGRCAGSEQGGEIIIYNIFCEEFTLQARVRVMPYDVMGTWLNESHILSAMAHIASRRRCLCEVLLNTSSQEVEELSHSTVTRLFTLACPNYNTVSYLRVADLTKVIGQVHRSINLGCFRGKLHDMHIKALTRHRQTVDSEASTSNQAVLTTTHSESPPGDAFGRTVKSISVKVMDTSADTSESTDSSPQSSSNKKLKLDDIENSVDVAEYTSRLFDPSIRRCMTEPDNDSEGSNIYSGTTSPMLTDDELDRDESESADTTTGDESQYNPKPPSSYKLLICFTGDEADVPHQIGIKLVIQEECTKVVRREFDLAKLRSHQPHGLNERPEPKTDNWDHVIDMGGQVVGMVVSPCNKYLYVNVRKWVGGADPFNTQGPIPISSDVTLHIFDLVSMDEVKCLSGHQAKSDVFFLHISCNSFYVSSGSENKQGYLWDRHYGNVVSTLRHENVVNCVALNPRDPSMAVSVSDDRMIKIWRSKSFHRLLNAARAKSRIKQGAASLTAL